MSAATATPTSTPLELNRRLQNHAFESWKIGSSFVASRTAVGLPGSVFLGAAEAVDFAHTKAALLCNHLLCSQGRLFVVTAAAARGAGIVVSELQVPAGEDEQAAPGVLHVADIPGPVQQPGGGAAADAAPADAALHCSLAVLATPPPPAAAAAAPGSSPPPFQALVSTGKGDLVLLTHTPGHQQPARVSAAVFPLRPQAPASVAKAFSIAAAWLAPGTGLIRALVSCLTDTSAAAAAAGGASGSSGPAAAAGGAAGAGAGQRHGHSSWVCEVWLVTLSAQEEATASAPQQQLQVLDCQLLHVCRAPPAAAVACAAADKVLMVAEPALEEGELPPGYKQQLAATLGFSEQQQQQQQPAGAAPMDTDPAGGAAGGPADVAAMSAGCDEDGDDLSPRTLAAAAARLAKYASETPVGELPQQQWSDVFKESGPGELGAGGSEPAVDVLLFGPADAHTASSSNHDSSRSDAPPAATGRFELKSTAACGPHNLLVADSFIDAHAAVDGLLLGLTDDVDCAVVSAAFSSGNPAAAAAAAAGSSGSSSCAGALVLNHTALLPAIAYVTAGKTQRRHLLLAPAVSTAAPSPVCCALVEASKYAYLYGQVPPGSTHGQQQIVDMELPAGQSILGARLLQLGHGSGSIGSVVGGAAAPSNTAALLLLLTQSQVILYRLRAPA